MSSHLKRVISITAIAGVLSLPLEAFRWIKERVCKSV